MDIASRYAKEFFKHLRFCVIRNAHTLVRNNDFNILSVVGSAYSNVRLIRRILFCIIDDIMDACASISLSPRMYLLCAFNSSFRFPFRSCILR